MNSSWMLSSMLVSMLIFAAALVVERMCMLRRGAPLRWVWLVAMGLSIGWSARWLLPARPNPETAPLAVEDSYQRTAMPTAAGVTQWIPEVSMPSTDVTTRLPILTGPLLSQQTESRLRLTALGLSLTLLLALAWSHARLTRERRQWRSTSLLDAEVLLSEGFGPAIVGMRRPSIVVPPWVLDVDASAQHAILLHEDEHRRAGDQWLLLASFGALLLAPWNVALWLMRRRLARAIELDCDQRVLAHGVADVEYANVLLNAWQAAHGAMRWIPSPALAEHVSRLGRRVEHLMRPAPRGIVMKTIGGAFMSVVLMGAAAFVPAPPQAQSRPATQPPLPPAVVQSVRPAPPTVVKLGSRPSATPRKVARAVQPAAPPPTIVQVMPPAPPAVRVEMASPPPPPTIVKVTPQKRGRLLIVMPWDSSAASLVRAVHERLEADTQGKPLVVISHADFVRFASAAGFDTYASLKPADVKAMGQLVRADLVVALQLRPLGDRVHLEATAIDPKDGVHVRILDGDGSVPSIADVVVRALNNVPAYRRLLQAQTDAAGAAPAWAPLDSSFTFAFHSRPFTTTWKARLDSTYRKFSFQLEPSMKFWYGRSTGDSTTRRFRTGFPPVANGSWRAFKFDSMVRWNKFRKPPVG